MKRLNQKQYHLFAFITAGLLTIGSFYFQYIVGLAPCALCIIQRGLMIALLVLFFRGIFTQISQQRLLNIIIFITAILGVFVAGRQTYLQYWAPADVISCGPSLSFVWNYLSWTESLMYLFNGAGSCSEVQWQLMGISMPAWVLLFFLGFAVLAFINFIRLSRKTHITLAE